LVKYSRMPVNIHHVIQSEAKNDNLVSMVKKPPKKWAEPRQKRGKFSLFDRKDLLNTGQNVGKNGLPTCFLQVTYMGNSLTINEDVGNVGM